VLKPVRNFLIEELEGRGSMVVLDEVCKFMNDYIIDAGAWSAG
jgi:hypothetical protein